MIRLLEVHKRFGAREAVKNLSLHVPAGELFGFLGPNGAGKTTTIKMIAGLLQPTSGSIFLAGHDLKREPVKAKAALGFIPDRPSTVVSNRDCCDEVDRRNENPRSSPFEAVSAEPSSLIRRSRPRTVRVRSPVCSTR